jgi:hypothetical protein
VITFKFSEEWRGEDLYPYGSNLPIGDKAHPWGGAKFTPGGQSSYLEARLKPASGNVVIFRIRKSWVQVPPGSFLFPNIDFKIHWATRGVVTFYSAGVTFYSAGVNFYSAGVNFYSAGVNYYSAGVVSHDRRVSSRFGVKSRRCWWHICT